jgi:hypothetical protein
MVRSCQSIGEIVLRVQRLFLEDRGLKATLVEVQNHLGLDAVSCGAVLNLLAEAGVVMRTAEGRYRRFFPRAGSRSIRHAAIAEARHSFLVGSYGGEAA